MSTLNDCMYSALLAQGFGAEALNDMLLKWAQANGATAPQLNDALYEMLVLQGATPATLNDMWYEVLVNLGITPGALNDMLYEFWCNLGGAFNLIVVRGWSDGNNCAGGGKYVVQLSSDLFSFATTGLPGSKFTNVTQSNNAGTVTTATKVGNTIEFDVDWTPNPPPVAEDVLEYSYTGSTNEILDDSLVPMVDQIKTITNCLDVAPSVIAPTPDQAGVEGTPVTPVDTRAAFDEGTGSNPVYETFGLPPGITIDGAGVASGTPTTPGIYTVSTALTMTTNAEPKTVTDTFQWTIDSAVPSANNWLTESNGNWLTESGDNWKTEAAGVLIFVTHLGFFVSHLGEFVTYG